VDVVIRQPDDLDRGGDLRDHALRIGQPRVAGGEGVNVEIGGERAVRRPRALELDRELDAAATLGQVDVALGALVFDAAPGDVVIAAVRDRRRRHAAIGADRDLGDAAADDQPIPRADHGGCDHAGRAALALAVEVEIPHMERAV
jgi:hypothetical protein